MLLKRDKLRIQIEKILRVLGAYKSYKDIGATPVKRLVFICSGNICRSAYGEAYAKTKGIEAVSFGVHCPDGDPANERMMKTSAKQHILLDNHRTMSMTSHEARPGDLIVAVDKKHVDIIRKEQPSSVDNSAILLGLFAKDSRATIIDPYGRPEVFFDDTVDDIKYAVDELVRHLQTHPITDHMQRSEI
ncbi:MAG: low molecular weight phosphatase family protein [Pseudomonadales bacterium]